MSSRNWCFTLNNYTPEEEALVQNLPAKYIVYGREIGKEGTKHLQGFVVFRGARNLDRVSRLFNKRAHLEIKRGTFAQAIEYCKKDGDVFEEGVQPLDPKEKGEKEREKWSIILQKAKEGDECWLAEYYPQIYFKSLPLFRSHKAFNLVSMDYSDNETPHEWWYGETGTGKSRKLNDDYPDHYPKLVNKWWCSYRGEEVVAIEEWPREVNDILISYLKKWVDRYKFMAEFKGGSFVIRPPKIIVLSNFSLEESFPKIDDLQPLKRRFKVTKFVKL